MHEKLESNNVSWRRCLKSGVQEGPAFPDVSKLTSDTTLRLPDVDHIELYRFELIFYRQQDHHRSD